jgi:transposase
MGMKMKMKIRCYNNSPSLIDERLVREQRIMSNLPLFVGVDYHQDQLQLCVIDSQSVVRQNRPFVNDAREVAKLLAGLGTVKAVAIEACCGASHFGEELLSFSPPGGFRVELAHPGYVARLKQSPDKTDYGDARLLADLLRVGYLPGVWLAPAAVRELRQLVNHRQRLVDQRRAMKLQIGAILREQRIKPEGSRWSKQWTHGAKDHPALSTQARWIVNDLLEELEHVMGRIRQVEKRLREATQDNALVKKLRSSIEGAGEVTAWMLAAWIGDFGRFKNGKQLSRYCGLSPRNASSGQVQADAGLVNAANKSLRAVLIQAAHRLMRNNERWKILAGRMLKKGKHKCVVTAAIANRWVRSMHHRLRADQPAIAPRQENPPQPAE